MKNACLLLVLAAVGLLSLQSCSGRTKLDALGPRDVILAFGDSLTAGYGAGPGESYPEQLALLTGMTVVNGGVSGDTTVTGLARLPGVLEEAKPALMILLLGGNDFLRGLDQALTRRNLAAMIELARSKRIQVVLIGVPERSVFSTTAPVFRDLADSYRLVLEGTLVADLLRRPEMRSDPIHFNAAGYREMAVRIHKLLKEHGAL